MILLLGANLPGILTCSIDISTYVCYHAWTRHTALCLKGGGHAKIIADFLDKCLAGVVLKLKISFLKFLEFIKAVK